MISVISSKNYVATAVSNAFVCADSKELLDSNLTNLLNLLAIDPSHKELFSLGVKNLKPTNEGGDSTTLSIVKNDALLLLTLAVLPNSHSRHNSPAKGYVLSSLLQSHKSSNVFLVPATNQNVFAQVCACSRQFPNFSLKSGNSDTLKGANIVVLFPQGEDEKLITSLNSLANDIRLCQRLVDIPPNLLNCTTYVDEAKAIFGKLSDHVTSGAINGRVSLEVIRGSELEARGFGGIFGVGKASVHPPALVILSYFPTGADAKPSVCMVGKGIVYDTGGHSIKVPPNMAGMKRDMGGSAAVLCAFDSLVMTGGCTSPLHCLLCIAENSISEVATRPDDIHTLYSGKTVEINNTDAEGRLVLADGCCYAAKHLNAAYIMDMATLTGAQGIATGKRFSALYCNSDALEELTVAAGKFTGDLAHPMPYSPELFKGEFKSAVADMKNSVADRTNAQVSCAGQFIGNHIEDWLAAGGQWVHCDMAYPVHNGERATGYGVALFYEVVQRLQKVLN